MSATDTDNSDDDFAFLEIEENLRELKTAAKLLVHMSTTEMEIGGDELTMISSMIRHAHDDIERRWKLINKQQNAEVAQLLEQVKEAKARKAAPGSVDDAKSLDVGWIALRAVAKAILSECNDRSGDRKPPELELHRHGGRVWPAETAEARETGFGT